MRVIIRWRSSMHGRGAGVDGRTADTPTSRLWLPPSVSGRHQELEFEAVTKIWPCFVQKESCLLDHQQPWVMMKALHMMLPARLLAVQGPMRPPRVASSVCLTADTGDKECVRSFGPLIGQPFSCAHHARLPDRTVLPQIYRVRSSQMWMDRQERSENDLWSPRAV